jgi:hypothetical protein
MAPRTVLVAVVKRKIHSPRRESNPDRPATQRDRVVMNRPVFRTCRVGHFTEFYTFNEVRTFHIGLCEGSFHQA